MDLEKREGLQGDPTSRHPPTQTWLINPCRTEQQLSRKRKVKDRKVTEG